MNFLINLWQKATKGDNFRIPDSIVTYNDKIAQLNATSANQTGRLTASKIQKISKSGTALTANSTGTATVPGTR
jgi:hypothetical protein